MKFRPDGYYLLSIGLKPAGFFEKLLKRHPKDGELHHPHGIVIDEHGHLYVVDRWNNRIQKFKPVSLKNVLSGKTQ
jgi:hypothetical protein